MSKAFLSSSSSHSTITETSCDFYPDNSNQARECNLFLLLGRMKEAVTVTKKNHKIMSSIKLHRRLATKVEIAINRNLTYLF